MHSLHAFVALKIFIFRTIPTYCVVMHSLHAFAGARNFHIALDAYSERSLRRTCRINAAIILLIICTSAAATTVGSVPKS